MDVNKNKLAWKDIAKYIDKSSCVKAKKYKLINFILPDDDIYKNNYKDDEKNEIKNNELLINETNETNKETRNNETKINTTTENDKDRNVEDESEIIRDNENIIKEKDNYIINNTQSKKVIKVFNESFLNTITSLNNAMTIKNQSLKVLSIIEADNHYPITYVKSGVPGTEFDLYRISNISAMIDESLYPLEQDEFIFCPDVTIFVSIENNVYKTLKRPYKTSFILIRSISRPSIININSQSLYNNKVDRMMMINKINNILTTAVNNKYNCLLLNDFGCGKQGNPINEVIKYINKAIKNDKDILYFFFYINNECFEIFHNDIIRINT